MICVVNLCSVEGGVTSDVDSPVAISIDVEGGASVVKRYVRSSVLWVGEVEKVVVGVKDISNGRDTSSVAYSVVLVSLSKVEGS